MCCESAAAKIAGSVSCLVLTITAIVLIIISFSALEPNEVGLEFKGPTQSLNTEKLYENGRHFLGVGHKFFVYPKDLQSVRFSGDSAIQARTKDGLQVSVAVAFNYKIQTTISSIVQLYLLFGEMDDVTRAYNRIARNWVRVVSSRHDAFGFFLNRTAIQVEMQNALDAELRGVYASVDSLQLLDIKLPTRFESSRIRQETAVQEIQQALNEREVAKINAETSVERARKEAEVIGFDAQASADAVQLQTEASLQALIAKYRAERESYAKLAAEMGLSPEELLGYIWLDSFENRQPSGGILHMALPTDLQKIPY